MARRDISPALRSLNSKLTMMLLIVLAINWSEPASFTGITTASMGNFFVSAHQTIEDDEEVPLADEPIGQAAGAAAGADVVEESNLFSNMTMPSGFDRKGIWDKIKEFFSHEPMWYYKYYKFELCCLMVTFVLFAQFFAGKEQNVQLVTAWQKRCASQLISEFEHLGVSKELKSYSMMQLSYTRFDFFASARKNVLYAEFKLNLIRRQCFITNYIYDPILGNVDNLTIEMPLDPQNNYNGLSQADGLPLELFICRIRDVAARRKEIKSLGNGLINQVSSKHFQLTPAQLKQKNNLQIFAEHSEIAGSLIDQYLGQALVTLGATGMLHELHITDLGTYSAHPLVLRAVIQLPSDASDSDGFEKVSSIVSLCLYFADKVAALRLSANVRDKLDKSRKKLRAEALAKQADENDDVAMERKRKDREAEQQRVSKMTPDQARKYQEKADRQEKQRKKQRMVKNAKV